MKIAVLFVAWTVILPVLAVINIVQLGVAVLHLLWMFINHIFEMPFEAWRMCGEIYDQSNK